MADVLLIRQQQLLREQWARALQQQQYIIPPAELDAVEPPHPRPDLWPSPVRVAAAGKATDLDAEAYDSSECAPDDVIGGVARLFDAATAAKGERMHRPQGLSDPAPNAYAPLMDGDASRGVYGGWLAAEPCRYDASSGVARHHVGFREGSAPWRRHVCAAAERTSVRTQMRVEADRAARFFGGRAELEAAAADADERARQESDARAAVAVERQRCAAATPHYEKHVEPSRPLPTHGSGPHTVGYRPGSAAARRAAGVLYEGLGVYRGRHSGRLNMIEDARVREQQAAARTALERRVAARERDEVAHDVRQARLEAQAERRFKAAPNGTRFGEHASRMADRKTINMTLNRGVASYQ
jgi:hypothetical protein